MATHRLLTISIVTIMVCSIVNDSTASLLVGWGDAFAGSLSHGETIGSAAAWDPYGHSSTTPIDSRATLYPFPSDSNPSLRSLSPRRVAHFFPDNDPLRRIASLVSTSYGLTIALADGSIYTSGHVLLNPQGQTPLEAAQMRRNLSLVSQLAPFAEAGFGSGSGPITGYHAFWNSRPRYSPELSRPGFNFSSLAAKSCTTFAIVNGTQLWWWGVPTRRNVDGSYSATANKLLQCGSLDEEKIFPKTFPSPFPMASFGLPSHTGVKSISCSQASETCAFVTSSGEVYTFGRNSRLSGNATVAAQPGYIPLGTKITQGYTTNDAIKVSVGSNMVALLTSSGNVFTWSLVSTIPTLISFTISFTDISVVNDMDCALLGVEEDQNFLAIFSSSQLRRIILPPDLSDAKPNGKPSIQMTASTDSIHLLSDSDSGQIYTWRASTGSHSMSENPMSGRAFQSRGYSLVTPHWQSSFALEKTRFPPIAIFASPSQPSFYVEADFKDAEKREENDSSDSKVGKRKTKNEKKSIRNSGLASAAKTTTRVLSWGHASPLLGNGCTRSADAGLNENWRIYGPRVLNFDYPPYSADGDNDRGGNYRFDITSLSLSSTSGAAATSDGNLYTWGKGTQVHWNPDISSSTVIPEPYLMELIPQDVMELQIGRHINYLNFAGQVYRVQRTLGTATAPSTPSTFPTPIAAPSSTDYGTTKDSWENVQDFRILCSGPGPDVVTRMHYTSDQAFTSESYLWMRFANGSWYRSSSDDCTSQSLIYTEANPSLLPIATGTAGSVLFGAFPRSSGFGADLFAVAASALNPFCNSVAVCTLPTNSLNVSNIIQIEGRALDPILFLTSTNEIWWLSSSSSKNPLASLFVSYSKTPGPAPLAPQRLTLFDSVANDPSVGDFVKVAIQASTTYVLTSTGQLWAAGGDPAKLQNALKIERILPKFRFRDIPTYSKPQDFTDTYGSIYNITLEVHLAIVEAETEEMKFESDGYEPRYLSFGLGDNTAGVLGFGDMLLEGEIDSLGFDGYSSSKNGSNLVGASLYVGTPRIYPKGHLFEVVDAKDISILGLGAATVMGGILNLNFSNSSSTTLRWGHLAAESLVYNSKWQSVSNFTIPDRHLVVATHTVPFGIFTVLSNCSARLWTSEPSKYPSFDTSRTGSYSSTSYPIFTEHGEIGPKNFSGQSAQYLETAFEKWVAIDFNEDIPQEMTCSNARELRLSCAAISPETSLGGFGGGLGGSNFRIDDPVRPRTDFYCILKVMSSQKAYSFGVGQEVSICEHGIFTYASQYCHPTDIDDVHQIGWLTIGEPIQDKREDEIERNLEGNVKSKVKLLKNDEHFNKKKVKSIAQSEISTFPNPIELGYEHGLTLSSSGKIVAFGSNKRGQCGVYGGPVTDFGDFEPFNQQIVVPGVQPSSLRDFHSSSYTSLSSSSEFGIPVIVPTHYIPLSWWKVIAGGFSSYAIASPELNLIVSWGDNSYGQLGTTRLTRNETTESGLAGARTYSRFLVPVKTPTTGFSIRDLSCTSFNCYLIYSNGDVYTWGATQFGLLGRQPTGASIANGIPNTLTPPRSGSILIPTSRRPSVFDLYDPLPSIMDTLPWPIAQYRTNHIVTHPTANSVVFRSKIDLTPPSTAITCDAALPVNGFQCVDGSWTWVGDLVVGGEEGAPPVQFVIVAPVQIYGNLSVYLGANLSFIIETGDITNSSDRLPTPKLNISECLVSTSGLSLTINLDTWNSLGRTLQGLKISFAEVGECSSGAGGVESGDSLNLYLPGPEAKPCTKTNARVEKVETSPGRSTLTAVFTLSTTSNCNSQKSGLGASQTWWIVLICVIAVVLLAVAIIAVSWMAYKTHKRKKNAAALRSS